MKYPHYEFVAGELNTAEEARELNAKHLELARVTAWHATFNAALTGFAGDGFGRQSIVAAVEIANQVHGSIE